MAEPGVIKWWDSALDRELRSAGGVVGRYCNHLARAIAMEASNIANETLERRTGRLAAGYMVRVERTPAGAIFTVYNTVRGTKPNRAISYAGVMEFGSVAHPIRPRKAGTMLVFWIGGRKIVTHVVAHPGTKPYAILSQAAERIGGRI